MTETPLPADRRPDGPNAGVDPRSPRVGAALTAAVLVIVLLTGSTWLLAAQVVLVTGIGLAAALAGVPAAVEVSAALALVAALLNAVFGLCLGCELYLLLARLRSPRTVQ